MLHIILEQSMHGRREDAAPLEELFPLLDFYSPEELAPLPDEAETTLQTYALLASPIGRRIIKESREQLSDQPYALQQLTYYARSRKQPMVILAERADAETRQIVHALRAANHKSLDQALFAFFNDEEQAKKSMTDCVETMAISANSRESLIIETVDRMISEHAKSQRQINWCISLGAAHTLIRKSLEARVDPPSVTYELKTTFQHPITSYQKAVTDFQSSGRKELPVACIIDMCIETFCAELERDKKISQGIQMFAYLYKLSTMDADKKAKLVEDLKAAKPNSPNFECLRGTLKNAGLLSNRDEYLKVFRENYGNTAVIANYNERPKYLI